MQILSAPTEDSVLTELTYLSDDVAVAANSISVTNPQGFATDDYIVIERVRSETAEVVKIASVSGSEITLSTALNFLHKDGVRIQKILFNQRRFYRSTSETGSYTLLATKSIEVDRPDGTFYEDSTGTSTSWYKSTYYNSTTDVETTLADAVACKAAESEHYTSLWDIRKQAGFEDAFGIKDETIAAYRDEAENEFEAAIVSVYTIPLVPKPKIVRQIINLLAAGNLLIKEYGMEADIEISKSGQRMLDRAYDLINKIVNKTLKLVDDDGDPLTLKTNTTEASTSNVYSSQSDRGELFNTGDEQFKFKDPSSPNL